MCIRDRRNGGVLMCSLFGLIDYNKRLTIKQKNRILNTLARECEVRGTDATGIAYNFAGRIDVYKRQQLLHPNL